MLKIQERLIEEKTIYSVRQKFHKNLPSNEWFEDFSKIVNNYKALIVLIITGKSLDFNNFSASGQKSLYKVLKVT